MSTQDKPGKKLVKAGVYERLTSDMQKVLDVGDDNAKKIAEKVNSLSEMKEPPSSLGFFGKLWAGVKGAIIPTAVSSSVVAVLGGLGNYAMSEQVGDARTAAAINSSKNLFAISGLIGGAFNTFGGYKTADAEREAERRLWSMIHGKPLNGEQVASAAPAKQEGVGTQLFDTATSVSTGLPPGVTGALRRQTQQSLNT